MASIAMMGFSAVVNAVHQADLLFLPHDKLPREKKIYKYALTVVDVASRYKAAVWPVYCLGETVA